MSADRHSEVSHPGGEIVAQFQTTRIRSLVGYNMAGYKRIFQLSENCALTLDPGNFTVTNSFPYGDIAKLGPDDKHDDQLDIWMEDRSQFTFQTAFRGQLLCQFFECITKQFPNKFPAQGPFNGQRLKKNGTRVENTLLVASYGIIEQDSSGKVLKEYHFVNITRVGSDEQAKAFFFESSGRIKIFFCSELTKLIQIVRIGMNKLGMQKDVVFVSNQNVNDAIALRNKNYRDTGTAVSVFDVNKVTRRVSRPVPRQMHVTESYIVEKDVSGFQYVSFQKISSVYSIVRNWTSPREFTIEYDDGTSRTYTSAMRDTLLAMIVDVCHASGNMKVIVTGEISDNLRLMPRFAEENYESSIKDAFFGSSSIEAWFLARMAKMVKPPNTVDASALELAARELNANVACPGIAQNSDPTIVKTALTGLLKVLNKLVIEDMRNDRNGVNTRSIISLLQSLYRIITSNAGYKVFTEIKEVDTRLLTLQLLKMGNDFINYWTLLLLTSLCNCPLNPRQTKQEFVNKHTLLTDKMLVALIDLMSSRIDNDKLNAEIEVEVEGGEEDLARVAQEEKSRSRSNSIMSDNNSSSSNSNNSKLTPKVARNASNMSHLPGGLSRNSGQDKIDTGAKKERLRSNSQDEHEGGTTYPNSLVIIASASLLESIVSSKRDSSSPELMNKVLDLMEQRTEVLINMLRSSSFLIMENAAILMFVLLKNRSSTSPAIKEMALSEGLTLKHFYHAVFSPSGSQRFISRFLISTWLAGSNTTPGKALLRRILPSGLVEYLKMSAITEEQRKNLDEMEEVFYARSGGQASNVSNEKKEVSRRASDMQIRMRHRLGVALADPILKANANAVLTSTNSKDGESQLKEEDLSQPPRERMNSAAKVVPKSAPENYRIMFHVMTNDHRMPDLIWNEQTRLELRSALEAEIKEFDREQRLRGASKIAWNYQQFCVVYASLKNEMQVGPIYVRHFLDADEGFLRSFENPSHVVLFEKLFRRVLVNVDKNIPISVLCTKCLIRLYQVCR